MGTYTYPGVYIQEVPSAVHTIAGVATSIAAFVGWAPQGSLTEAILVNSFMDFQRQFGGLDARSLLGYSLSQFLNNGGQQAHIVRLAQQAVVPATVGGITITGTAVAGAVTMTAGGSASLLWSAQTPGLWSSSLGILISSTSGTKFDAAVVYAPGGTPLITLEGPSALDAASLTAPESAYVSVTARALQQWPPPLVFTCCPEAQTAMELQYRPPLQRPSKSTARTAPRPALPSARRIQASGETCWPLARSPRPGT